MTLFAVDNSKTMLGTFSPQAEAYTYETKEETTPTIIFARGSYCVRTKVQFEQCFKNFFFSLMVFNFGLNSYIILYVK